MFLCRKLTRGALIFALLGHNHRKFKVYRLFVSRHFSRTGTGEIFGSVGSRPGHVDLREEIGSFNRATNKWAGP